RRAGGPEGREDQRDRPLELHRRGHHRRRRPRPPAQRPHGGRRSLRHADQRRQVGDRLVIMTGSVDQLPPSTRLPAKVRGLIFVRDQGLLVLWIAIVIAFSYLAALFFVTPPT